MLRDSWIGDGSVQSPSDWIVKSRLIGVAPWFCSRYPECLCILPAPPCCKYRTAAALEKYFGCLCERFILVPNSETGAHADAATHRNRVPQGRRRPRGRYRNRDRGHPFMRVTFLGTGTSHGVPSIDCMLSGHANCRKGVCRASASDPHHARTRCSIHVDFGDHAVLCDCSLDFRAQVLRERVQRIDALLLTHRHMDHMGGIPDLRSFTPQALPLYASEETIHEAQQAFAYVFAPDTFVGGGITRLSPHAVRAPFALFGRQVTPVSVEHGVLQGCFGYRIGPLAYIPDMKRMAPEEAEKLHGLDCLILNCLRDERPHATHMILEESIAFARVLAPRRCFFVHMSHDIHYELDQPRLDSWMRFAYDGLVIDIEEAGSHASA
jgi:phosphoribosyl 1,2-cyclic phosphate phosphodiesterase